MRNFSARETEWLLELDGIELANFRRRAFAFLIDWLLITFITLGLIFGGTKAYDKTREMRNLPKSKDLVIDLRPDEISISSPDPDLEKTLGHKWIHILENITLPILYFGLLTWRGKGRTPGKRLMKIRVVSLVHRHLSLWHSVERALGYGAAFLEAGFGFIQFFIHPYRRCVQDRIAETIVVTERGYRLMQSKQSHPLLPDEGNLAETHRSDEALPQQGA